MPWQRKIGTGSQPCKWNGAECEIRWERKLVGIWCMKWCCLEALSLRHWSWDTDININICIYYTERKTDLNSNMYWVNKVYFCTYVYLDKYKQVVFGCLVPFCQTLARRHNNRYRGLCVIFYQQNRPNQTLISQTRSVCSQNIAFHYLFTHCLEGPLE